MTHPIYRVDSFAVRAPHTLIVRFDDGATRTIDFTPILRGELFGPLSDPRLFEQVSIDPETRTLVWPNGADFDPATLHDWPESASEMTAAVSPWKQTAPAAAQLSKGC